MERSKLTKRAVDGAGPQATRYVLWDAEVPGFGLRVTPAGKKTYVLKYRVGGGRSGRVRWAVIGGHGAVTPDMARGVARAWAAEVAQGGDPAAAKEARRNAPSVAALLERYLEDHARPKNKPSTLRNVEVLIERVILPEFGRLKVADVSRADIAKFHSALSGTPYQANRALALLSKAMNLAEIWGWRPDGSNPCMRVERFEEKARERFLTAAEFHRLGAVLTAAEAGELRVPGKKEERLVKINPEAIRALRLLIFTGARVGEVLALRWEQVDLTNRRANLSDSKTGKKVLQLPPPAIEVLEAASHRTGFVIRGGDASNPDIPLINLKDPWRHVRAAAGLADVRMHDLRHAFASVGAAGGLSLLMIGALLGHKDAKTTQRYAHLADDPQKAAADQTAAWIADAILGKAP